MQKMSFSRGPIFNAWQCVLTADHACFAGVVGIMQARFRILLRGIVGGRQGGWRLVPARLGV